MMTILAGKIDDFISVVEQTLQRPESLLHGDAVKMRTYVRYLYELSKLRRMQNEFLPYLMRYGIPMTEAEPESEYFYSMGIKRGEKRGPISVALRMKSEGYGGEDILRLTGVDVNQHPEHAG
jgi:hypothetical protein